MIEPKDSIFPKKQSLVKLFDEPLGILKTLFQKEKKKATRKDELTSVTQKPNKTVSFSFTLTPIPAF